MGKASVGARFWGKATARAFNAKDAKERKVRKVRIGNECYSVVEAVPWGECLAGLNEVEIQGYFDSALSGFAQDDGNCGARSE